MKRLYLVTPLLLSAILLSGCPDAKLPSPIPKVPEPKAEKTAEQPFATLRFSPLAQQLNSAKPA